MAKSPKAEKPEAKRLTWFTMVRTPATPGVPEGGYAVLQMEAPAEGAKTLAPHWRRDRMETRPGKVTSEPDNQGRTVTQVLPVLTKVGEYDVHGEKGELASGRWNAVGGVLRAQADARLNELTTEQLNAMLPAPKPPRKRAQETAKDRRIRAERALDLLGKPDVVVARVLREAGRSEEQIQAYLRERAA